jgi:hypothetical protein
VQLTDRQLKEDVTEARAWSERRSINIPIIEQLVRPLGVEPRDGQVPAWLEREDALRLAEMK